MMKPEALYNVLSDADKLSAFSVDDLRQMIVRFPYFQTARKLLLRKLQDLDNDAFDDELKQSSVYIGDRAKLYFYLNTNVSPSSEVKDQALPDLSLITKQNLTLSDSISMSGRHDDASFNYLFLSEEEVSVINREEEQPMEQVEFRGSNGMELIDKFMTDGGGRIKPSINNDGPVGNLAEDSVRENPSILTETLARIYIKQKKYDKAIDIFNNLSLKFPEKSAYFADRIKELDILIKSS